MVLVLSCRETSSPVKYIDPNEDYDNYCKNNDMMRALLFLFNDSEIPNGMELQECPSKFALTVVGAAFDVDP